MSQDSATRFTLRQLPLPAKLVLTVFLLAVGLGYFSALVQLHMKHSKKDGSPMPSPADVVEVFSGLKAYDPAAATECAKIDTLVSGDPDAADVSKTNMAPAFFAKAKGGMDGGKRNGPAGRVNPPQELKEQRETERQAMLAWVRLTDPAAKKAAYDTDAFLLPADLQSKGITPEFAAVDKTVKIRSMIDTRCVKCHEEQGEVKLDSYAALEPFVTPPSPELIDGKWVKSSRQTSVEALTQSTHAHLLSFAVLFMLTGLVFAFTSFTTITRSILGPIVLIAQVADVSCWWLARVPGVGPTFALCILATGGVVGLGLALQIVLSLLNMYNLGGKVLVLLVLVGLGGAFGFIGLKVIRPALEAEKAEVEKAKVGTAKPDKVEPVPPAAVKVSHLEQLVLGPRVDAKFNGTGSMAPAFFEKDSKFAKAIAKDPKVKPTLEAERTGEQQAVATWLRMPDAERKKAYEADSLPWADGKPITAEFLDGKTAKVKSILDARCARCHYEGGEQGDYPLEKYEQFTKYFDPPAKK